MKNSNLKLSLGSDPESFVFSTEKNQIVSSIPILKTDKTKPINLGDGFNCYADNVLLEMTFSPAKSKEEIIKKFRTGFKKIQNRIGDKYKLVFKAAHEFSTQDLKPQFGIDPNEQGCNPSYNAWNAGINEPKPFKDGVRTGSAHFHVGHDLLKDFNNKLNAVKLLDIFLGSPFVIVDKDAGSIVRRRNYGAASEHRSTSYGLEYRVLSPYVLKSPKLVDLALDLISYSIMHIAKGQAERVIKTINPDEVIASINNCDVSLAKKVMKDSNLPGEFVNRIEANYGELEHYKEWGI